VTRRLFIFDVDGTLVDSQEGIVQAQMRAFAEVGLAPPTRARALSIVGLSLHEAFTTLMDGDDTHAARLSDAYRAAWTLMRQDAAFEEKLYPGAEGAIAALVARPDVTLGVATGKSRRGVDRLIAHCKWEGVFATVQTADDHPSKPAPAMILRALQETGVAATDAVMIGDTTFDMAMAQAAGVRAIGVAWGYHEHAHLIEAGAECVVRDFDDLLKRLG
jgi:phosphoglycolate phosphatase